jgi:glycine betaine/proline transport system permease protein
MQWYLPAAEEDFPDLGGWIGDLANEFVIWLVINAGWFFSAISDGILQPLLWLEQILRGAPPWVIVIAFGLIALIASRNIVTALVIIVVTYLLGALQLWDQSMQTIAIMVVAVVISVLIGLPLGILSARSNRFKAALSPLLDLMQTIPSFVYLIPVAMLFGLGKVPAIIATVIYATAPLVRLTDLGIREVSDSVTEAARSFGATRWQLLRGVQLPLALPTIMQGVNQTTMMALAMVVIASLIGARGVGQTVMLGLQRNDFGTGLIGGIAIVILAIIFDRITQSAGRRLQAHRDIQG